MTDENSFQNYPTSKLVQLLAFRAIADRTVNRKPFITINTVSPGLCVTDLARSSFGLEDQGYANYGSVDSRRRW
jgi:NAD(P)-dependent dehydrogenase (short-subunit alcohol dehydrogenase family)